MTWYLTAAWLWMVTASVVAFCLYGADKRFAKIPGHRRISERTLLGWAFGGGASGAFLAMHVFRHKTRHRKFTVFVPLFLLLQFTLLFYLTWSTTNFT